MEPLLNQNVLKSFYCPIAGVTEPWEVAMQAARSLEINGGKVFKEKKLVEVNRKNNKYELIFEDASSYLADLVVNACGLYADEVAKLFGDNLPFIFPVKGEYFLFGKDIKYTNSVIFPTPTPLTKGCLVVPTVDGGFLAGPNARGVKSKKDFSTTPEGLLEVNGKSLDLIPSLDFSKYCKSFCWFTSETQKRFLYRCRRTRQCYTCFRYSITGLTAAPAIAKP